MYLRTAVDGPGMPNRSMYVFSSINTALTTYANGVLRLSRTIQAQQLVVEKEISSRLNLTPCTAGMQPSGER